MTASQTYSSLGDLLVTAVPKLKPSYEALLRDWTPEAPGPHVVFGDLLNPYLLDLLLSPAQGGERDQALRRIFHMLELLAQDDDVRVQEVVYATVAERLGAEPNALAFARPYMLDATRRLSDDVERFWEGGSPPSRTDTEAVATTGGGSKHHL